MLEPNAELVLLEDPQPHQLDGDVLQGVELSRPSVLCLLLYWLISGGPYP
jgi:hypothetical protein